MLQDAWAHPVVTNRAQFKTIMRRVYGSSMPAAKMWTSMNIPFTAAEVAAYEAELTTGELAVADKLKNFMVNNCNMQATMNLVVDGESATVDCNKFNNVGEKTTEFDLYDTYTGRIRSIHNTETVRVPDLKAFKLYTVTGLIHRLDGQVMDKAVLKVMSVYNWVIPIHDAMVLCCEAANLGRRIYAEELTHIHTNRNIILSDYFTSIGIPASKLAEWKTQVVPFIQPYTGTFKCNEMVLK